MAETRKALGDKIIYSSDQYEAVIGADGLALMTEWAEFRIPDLVRMNELMKGKVIFDGRNIYDPVEIKGAGFAYYGIGRR
jgi:UDPglucose 6-dehydrogenase